MVILMAEFCKQCSIKVFGEDFSDFENIVTEEQEKRGFVIHVLCEECGVTYVNRAGECMRKDHKHDG